MQRVRKCKYCLCGCINKVVSFFMLFFSSTVPLSAVRRMTIYDEQTTTMRVRWEKVQGATGYMLLYSAINATQPSIEQEVTQTLH